MTTKSKSGRGRAAKPARRAPAARQAAKRGADAGSHALRKQWQLPAGYHADGTTLATLEDVLDPEKPTLSLSELTQAQRAELVARRIEAQKEFELVMLGAGLVNKARAAAEVRANSKVGKVLMQIEQRMISNLLEQAAQGSARTPAKSPTATARRGRARDKR